MFFNSDISQEKVNKYLIFLFVAGFLARLLFGLGYGKEIVAPDTAGYIALAKNIVSGAGYVSEIDGEITAYRAPGYPFFLALIYFIYPDSSLDIIKIINSLISSLTIIIIYKITKLCSDNKTSLLSAAIFTIYPASICFCGLILSETLCIFLFSLAILFYIQMLLEVDGNSSKKAEVKSPVLCGLFLGLATLVRPISFLLPLYLLGFKILLKKRFSLSIKNIIIIFICFLAVLLPWTIRNYIHFQKIIPVSTMGGLNIWQSLHPDSRGYGFTNWESIGKEIDTTLNEAENSALLLRKSLRFIYDNPKVTLYLSFLKIISYFSPFDGQRCGLNNPFNPFVGIIFIAAFWAIVKKELPIKILINYLLLILYFVIMTLIFYGSPRFRFQIDPILIVCASIGIFNMLKKGKTKTGIYLLAGIILFNLIIYLAGVPIAKLIKPLVSLLY